jgi:uncharacterized membrane protein YgdD (TMEM256/DUF423 family)
MGATSVILGAVGSHVIEGNISAHHMSQFNSGLLFQMFNTLVLLAITFMNRYVVRSYLNAVYYLFVIGTAFFSIPLYLISLSELTGNMFSVLSPLAPLGAIMMISGWVALFMAGTSYKHKKRSSKD